jgi:hypothetical protein
MDVVSLRIYTGKAVAAPGTQEMIFKRLVSLIDTRLQV